MHQLDASALGASAHLFAPRRTIRFRDGADLAGAFSGDAGVSGENPPSGVVVPYYFKEKPAGEVKLSFYKDGTLIQSFTSAGEKPPVKAEAGANRFVWDMRYPGANVLEGAVFQGSARGPVAAPGTYEVELVAGSESRRQSFEIARDPRLQYTDADLQEQFDFLIAVRDKLSETMSVVGRIREMRKRAEDAVERAGGTEAQKDALRELNDKLYPDRGAARSIPRPRGPGPHQLPYGDRQQARAAFVVRVDGRWSADPGREGPVRASLRRSRREKPTPRCDRDEASSSTF